MAETTKNDAPPDPRNPEAFQEWLETKPREWSVVIAARAALRVLPLVRAAKIGSEEANAILLPVFRATAIARFAAVYPNRAIEASAAAYEASAAAYADDAKAAAAASSSAAYAAAASSSAAYAASAAASAAAASSSAASAAAIQQDARALATNITVEQLARAPLRRSGEPGDLFRDVGQAWIELKNNLLRFGAHWQVWTDWYDEVLAGSPLPPRGEEWDAAFTDVEHSSYPWKGALPWDEGSEKVNLAVKARLDALISQGREFEQVAPEPEAELQPRAREDVQSQLDEPTADDQLYRKPFALALVERLDQLYAEHGQSPYKGSNGFAAHIHAPWGAGKTSVLKMMRQLMIASDRKAPDGRIAPRWVVVDFNAWEHERRNPPWWPLIEKVKQECVRSLMQPLIEKLKHERLTSLHLSRCDCVAVSPVLKIQWHWLWWKTKTEKLPLILALVVGALLFWLFRRSGGAPPAESTNVELILKLIGSGLAAYAAFLAASRFIVFGSMSAAQLFDSISHDPLMRVTKLFRTIVEKTGMPVCVFVDDLDRCRVPYVVELLGGIQTLFRHSSIFYVVAADRGWIKASFESSYDTFAKSVGNAGQPLGYLFLEKVFQLSTPLPGIGGERRAEYLKRLLGGRQHDRDGTSGTAAPAGEPGIKQFDATVASAREEIRRRHGDDLTPEQGEAIQKADPSSVTRTAVMLELNVSRVAEKEAKHLLESFVGMLPDNPRVMKRMINALAMRQAIDRLEQNEVPAAVLARWTILEQWWPALADLLIEHPEWIEQLRQGISEADKGKFAELQPFADFEAVRDIVGESDDNGLTTNVVRIITRGSTT